MHRLLFALLAMTSMMAVSVSTAQEPARHALLIGNKGYTAKVGPLKNPHTDVDLVEVSLKNIGFKVTVLKDASYKTMDSTLKRYVADVRRAGPNALSFVYYSGHGAANPETQINYLIPVDVADADDDKVWFESFQHNTIIDMLTRQASNAVHYVVLDACRNELNLTKAGAKALGTDKGFVPINYTTGVLIAYATAPGKTAADGDAGGGPYAKALADELLKPGVEAYSMFRNVGLRVKRETGQDPWLSSSTLPPVYLAGLTVAQPQPRADELSYKKYIESFEDQRPILKGELFTSESMSNFAFGILERAATQLAGKTWDGGDDWGRIVFDTIGRTAKYYDNLGRETGRLLLQGVMSDGGQTLGGTRGVTRNAEYVGEWHQNDGKASGGFILKFSNEHVLMSWGPLFRRQSRWQTSGAISSPPVALQPRLSDVAEAWTVIKDSTSIAALAAFVARYRDSFYGDLAKSRIADLKQAEAEKAARRKADDEARAATEVERQRVAMLDQQRQDEARKRTEAESARKRGESAGAMTPGRMFRDCPDCPEMVVVPAGDTMMGSPANEANRRSDEGPQRMVTIRQTFAVGKFEVTFAEWDSCVDASGCKHRPESSWGRGRQPVMRVSWDDTREYTAWLSSKTGKTYRLLTEAEWEYAARAGTTTPFSTGKTITAAQANFDGNYTYGGSAKGAYRQKTVDVGTFKPNAFGLYDMDGNVWEWVQDCFKDSYAGAPTDGRAVPETSGCPRVLRGGSWYYNPQNLRAANRGRNQPDIRNDDVGFRLARSLNP